MLKFLRLIALSALVVISMADEPSYAHPRSNHPTSINSSDGSDLILENYQVYKNSSRSGVCVVGKVKNISGKQLRYISPTVDYYTSSGEYIHSENGTIEPLIMLNGQEGQFFIDETYTNPQTGIVRIYFTNDEDKNKKEIPFFDPGAKKPLLVPVTQLSDEVCGSSIIFNHKW